MKATTASDLPEMVGQNVRLLDTSIATWRVDGAHRQGKGVWASMTCVSHRLRPKTASFLLRAEEPVEVIAP